MPRLRALLPHSCRSQRRSGLARLGGHLRFKFGALILSIPGPVIGGLSILPVWLDSRHGRPIWVENRIDFSNPRNLMTVAAALTAGAGDLTLKFGAFTMGGIGTATFGAIIFYQILVSDSAEQ